MKCVIEMFVKSDKKVKRVDFISYQTLAKTTGNTNNGM